MPLRFSAGLATDKLHSPHSCLPNKKKSSTQKSLIDIGTPGEMLLEKILEEESNYGDERNQHPSPNENDKKYLLGNGHTDGVNITRI